MWLTPVKVPSLWEVPCLGRRAWVRNGKPEGGLLRCLVDSVLSPKDNLGFFKSRSILPRVYHSFILAFIPAGSRHVDLPSGSPGQAPVLPLGLTRAFPS